MESAPDGSWTVESARDFYHVARWGAGYFDINEEGHVCVRPAPDGSVSIDLLGIVEEARRRQLRFPLVVRFQDILRHRIRVINEAFAEAIRECEYRGRYRTVFPVKVNQLREVVEEVVKTGRPWGLGLEVGSKSELLAALALQSAPESVLVCNGYKDSDFIRMALMGTRLGKRVYLVVEKPEELERIIDISRRTGVVPLFGIRARLLSKGGGKWADSSGEGGKFGLSTEELVIAADRLEEEGLSDRFELLHFHIGSQIPDIQSIKRAVQEATRIYVQLRKMGFGVKVIDVGGGLGVDYDGSRTARDSSTNYTLQEYANDVVYHIGEICNAREVPHPEILSESGRAIVAHHSALIVEVMGSIEKGPVRHPLRFEEENHPVIAELMEIRSGLPDLNKLEAFHDAMERLDSAHDMFNLGILGLRDKARIEHLSWEICRSVLSSFEGEAYIPEEIQEFRERVGAQYLCNFSVFQSLLDHWACDQLFPIMPLGRLGERPEEETTLVDITCDSEGRVEHFIGLEEKLRTLCLHRLEEGGDYFLGFFLMGAYQDIMGDLHNLFGRVGELHIFVDDEEPEGYYIEEIIPGHTVENSLRAVQYDERELGRSMKAQVEEAISSSRIKASEGMLLLQEYNAGLKEYTYLRF